MKVDSITISANHLVCQDDLGQQLLTGDLDDSRPTEISPGMWRQINQGLDEEVNVPMRGSSE